MRGNSVNNEQFHNCSRMT